MDVEIGDFGIVEGKVDIVSGEQIVRSGKEEVLVKLSKV
jgi:hypothetical protein